MREGTVKEVELQPKFVLQPAYEVAGKKIRPIIYRADFKVTKMKIKAYAWDDEDYGGSYFVWTTTPGKAKALLASEHDREFTEMRVYRVPWADKYGDNKIIPAKELLSNGWWLYCSNCGTRVQNDTATVLDAVEVLCDECAKDWNEKKGKK